MALAISVTLRNAGLDAFETATGTTPILKHRTGAAPGITAADSGTALTAITLPSDWLAASANGSKAKLGTWQGIAIAAGTAGHFRIYASNGTTVHWEGSVTVSGGGGDMILSTVTITVGLLVSVDNFTLDM